MANKRGNGEGTISKRKGGGWRARVSLPNGKRKAYYDKTRKEVRSKLAAAHRELDLGLNPDAGRQKVGSYLRWWLD